MSKMIWTEEYNINSFLVNSQKKLGLYSLLNLLQDAAWVHAEDLGYGYEATLQKSAFWVLTRQNLVMNEWPQWGQNVQIRTWIRPPERTVSMRDFEILREGKKLGECVTSWLLLDRDTRRPLRDAVEAFQVESRPDSPLRLETPKIEIQKPEALETLAEFQVRNSDLDVHHHVNNTRYAQWILDSIPMAWHSRFHLHQYEINFLAETKSNDLISILKSKEPQSKQDGISSIVFTGFRAFDQKFVFSARLHVSERP